MNIYLYSKKKRCRVSWASDTDDFDTFCNLLARQNPLIKISDSFILLSGSENVRQCVDGYCQQNEQKSRFNSRKIAAFISKLQTGEWFFILNGDVADDYERLSAIHALDNLYDITDINRLINIAHKSLLAYDRIKNKYNVFAYGIDESPVYMGEKEKAKRICRFCREPGKKYKDDAHSIPESLGNTKLFCREECDDCNHKLKTIEDNFIALMDVRRAMFRIKRKGTSEVPDIDGQNFVIRGNDKAEPTIYYMEEALPEGWQNMKEIPIRLNLKYKTTNENIYKALCKFAIDLMPAEYISQFDETIDWINSDGLFFPDSLPSCYMAVLPEGVFFEQPQLVLYLKKDSDTDSPFCFAILNIYDICYRFIVPFSKSDAGLFRSDESLLTFWNRFKTEPELTWFKQNTSDWWHSAPWAEFEIRANTPCFTIRPSDDEIFSKCHDTPEPEEWLYEDFNANQIEITIDKLKCECSSKARIPQNKLRDTTVEFTPPIFSFYENEQIIQLQFMLSARTTDNKIPYLKIHIVSYVATDKFKDQIKYEHLTVNADFTHAVWDKLMKEASKQISNRLKYTQFSYLNPLKDFSSHNNRFMRETIYDFHLIGDKHIRMPYKCAHEEMSVTNRMKLFRQANGA